MTDYDCDVMNVKKKKRKGEQVNRTSVLLLKTLEQRLDRVVCAGVDGEVRGVVAHLTLRLDLGRHSGEDGPAGHGGSVVGDGEASG